MKGVHWTEKVILQLKGYVAPKGFNRREIFNITQIVPNSTLGTIFFCGFDYSSGTYLYSTIVMLQQKRKTKEKMEGNNNVHLISSFATMINFLIINEILLMNSIRIFYYTKLVQFVSWGFYVSILFLNLKRNQFFDIALYFIALRETVFFCFITKTLEYLLVSALDHLNIDLIQMRLRLNKKTLKKHIKSSIPISIEHFTNSID